jgi:DNA-binding MarR family transcriptional regulator
MEDSSRTQLVNETIQVIVELVLTQKFADMPDWMSLDLTVSQVRAIYLLALHGSLSIGELAGLLKVGNPAASILVQQLVQQDLVERSEDRKDRRRTFVRLTERGAGLLSGRREKGEAKFRRWSSRMSDDELVCLLRGASALLKIMRADQAEAEQARR